MRYINKYRIDVCIVIKTCIMAIIFVSCNSGYQNDGKHVTYHTWNAGSGHTSWILDADPSTFEDLGDDFAHDSLYAFYHGFIIMNADGKSFRYLKYDYAIDKDYVFYRDSILHGIDPKSFKVHSCYLTEDSKDFYWKCFPIHVVDKSTFVVLGDIDENNTTWAKDRKKAYFMGESSVWLSDYESFHPIKGKSSILSYAYAADKDNVYYKDHIIKEADPQTFTEIDYEVGQDKHRVYYKGEVSDVKDYKKLSSIGSFFSDGKNLYSHELKRIAEADLHTFRQIENTNWYVDKNHVWWQNKLVEKANPKTIQPVYSYTYLNKERILSGADFNYGKDDKYVYFQDSIIPNADPATFEKIDLGEWVVFDKNRIYKGKDSKLLQEYKNTRH